MKGSHDEGRNAANRRKGEPGEERASVLGSGKTRISGQKSRTQGASKEKGRNQEPPREKGRNPGVSKEKSGNPGASREKSRNPGNRLAEKLLLEQSIAKVVNGQTGLLMFLDMLLHDAEEKDPAGFSCHAQGYLRRTEKLEPLVARYKTCNPQSPELKLYQDLVKIGKNLGGRMEKFSPEMLSDQELSVWRKKVLRCIDLYGSRQKP